MLNTPSSPETLIKNIIKDSGLPLKTFATAAELSAKEALDWWAGREKKLLLDRNISRFECFFGLSLESFTEGDESIKILRQRMHGKMEELPERYQVGANSYARSSFYIIRYIELLHGKEFVDSTLASLSIHPRFFENLDRKINLRFFNDLLKICEKLGFQEKHMRSVARSLFLAIENTSLEYSLLNCQSHEELYSNFANLINEFDSNFQYNFVISKSGVELTTKMKPVLQKIEKESYFDKVFAYRPILFGQLPALSKLPTLDVTVHSCFSRGDRFSRFSAAFPDRTRPAIRMSL